MMPMTACLTEITGTRSKRRRQMVPKNYRQPKLLSRLAQRFCGQIEEYTFSSQLIPPRSATKQLASSNEWHQAVVITISG
jgi:hypothetical protein